MHVCAVTYIHSTVHAHLCVCAGEIFFFFFALWKKPLWAFGSSTGEDKVVWGLLTRPMIHNWGRTAVAGCTDGSHGGWQMIEPSGAELSISPNVHCPLSAHPSLISLTAICKLHGHRSAIWWSSLNVGSSSSVARRLVILQKCSGVHRPKKINQYVKVWKGGQDLIKIYCKYRGCKRKEKG